MIAMWRFKLYIRYNGGTFEFSSGDAYETSLEALSAANTAVSMLDVVEHDLIPKCDFPELRFDFEVSVISLSREY